MKNRGRQTRRRFLGAGMASLLTASATSNAAELPVKKPGETWMLYFGGDYVHNGIGQERYIRQTFGKSGFRIFFAQVSRFITPELIGKLDLLMMNRVGDFDAQGFSPEGLVENRPEPDPFMDPAMENAIIDNVTNRGMGFIALHCTMGNLDNVELMKLIGIKPHKSGAILQPVRFHDFNPAHPISKGFTEIELEHDENLPKEIVDSKVVRLFKSTGLTGGKTVDGGWCAERGKGRIVALMAGHTTEAYRNSQYREIHWRAAHWAMRREIPPFEM